LLLTTIQDYQTLIIISLLNYDHSLEPNEIKFTPDYKANEPIFWGVFKELSKNNNGLVAYDKLQEVLLSTGKFYAGEAVLMIEHMEKTGKIEKAGDYNVYRIGKPVTTEEEEWSNMR
jgi:hypothetical protein